MTSRPPLIVCFKEPWKTYRMRRRSILLPPKLRLRRVHNARVTGGHRNGSEGETAMHICVGYELIYNCPEGSAKQVMLQPS
jgi:hypothetical protein